MIAAEATTADPTKDSGLSWNSHTYVDSVPDSLVRDSFGTLLGSDAPVGVTENGALIGQLGKDDVLRGLSPSE